MSTTAQLSLRSTRQVELVMPHRLDLLAFEVGAADTLDAAFTGTTAMFQVPSGRTFRSPSIRRARRGATQYTNRGLTRAVYDPQDYWVAAGALPTDAQQSYVRVAEVDLDGNVLDEGPILIVPRGGWLGSPRPHLTLAGTAPSLTTPSDLSPPVGAMHVVVPQFGDSIDIYNKSSNTLYIAFDSGSPGLIVPATTFRSLRDPEIKDMYLWGDGATAAFDIDLAIVNGEMA